MGLGLKIRRSPFQIRSRQTAEEINGFSPTVDTVNTSTYSIKLDTVSKRVLMGRERRSLELQNTSASAMWINIGGDAADGVGFTVAPGGSWTPPKAPRGEIHILGSYSGQSVVIIEGF